MPTPLPYAFYSPFNPKERVLFPLIKVDDVSHVIQLAVAPVFLLTAVGTIISVLTSRLARIVDRIRVVETRMEQMLPEVDTSLHLELSLLGRRLRLIYLAVTCEVCCGLLVGLIIATAFVDAFVGAKLSGAIAAQFILAMLAFIGGLVVFLREIFLAVASTRASMRMII